MSMQARPPIDDRRYGRILSSMCPRPIRNEGEQEQAIARLDDLDRRDQDLTPEERELAELYTALIEAYEERHRVVPFFIGFDQDLTPEERELAELYTALIEAYEERHYPVPHAPPHEFLRSLLVERGLTQAGIAHLLGGSGHTSEILSAKRSISKAQAKKLAGFFNLPAELFI